MASTSVKEIEAGRESLTHEKSWEFQDSSPVNSHDPFEVQAGGVHEPFHDGADAKVKYRTMGWSHASFLMIAEIVSLGILSLPAGIATLGLVPGIVCQIVIGVLGSYSGYLIWQFRMAHPTIQSFADAGLILGGPILQYLFFFPQYLNLVFIASAHILTFKTAMTTITSVPQCAIMWSVIAAVVCFLLSLFRTSKAQSKVSTLSTISITAAIIVVMIGVGLRPPKALVDASGIPMDALHDFHHPSGFVQGWLAILNMVAAFCGHSAFIGFISELEKPQDFPKALAIAQTTAITYYCIVAGVIYAYAGQAVISPAISSAPPRYRLIGYIVAMPTIIVAGVINMHVASKQIYVWWWRGTNVVNQRNFRSYGSWVGLLIGGWLLAWILAEAIPNFHEFLAIISALFNGWFMLVIPAWFWLFMNRGKWFKSGVNRVMFIVNIVVLLIGLAIFVVGLVTSGISLAHGDGGKPFSCARQKQSTTEVVIESFLQSHGSRK
ncbi:MAG: hypothetical protein M1820_000223 [Bogoriella megaspora]|nr:MAG: hypothetical protein M1820_000223 [Bogoriella megaspora]